MKAISPKYEELRTTVQLPSPPGVARELMKLAREEDVATADLVRVIKADPALAARLVRAANRGVMKARRPVASVPEAVIVLGMRIVRQFALGFSVLSTYRKGACKRFNYETFWASSLGTAVAFSEIAARVNAAPAEESFVFGLLSRMGSLALATLHPQEYSEVLQRHEEGHGPLIDLEREAFAVNHNELTAAMLLDWGMPKTMVDAATHQDAPEVLAFPESARAHLAARALRLAARLGDLCLAPDEARGGLYTEIRTLAAGLEMTGDEMLVLIDRVATEWSEWAPILDLGSEQMHLLPAVSVPDLPESVEAQTPAAATSLARPLRTLLVDDDPAVLIQLKKLFTPEGHVLATASNGQEALDKALSFQPDLVITDWIMPGLDGMALCGALRETAIGRAAYVMVLTSYADEALAVQALEAGADDYLQKPFRPEVLLARVRAAQRRLTLHHEVEREREDMRHLAADLAVSNRRFQEAALTDALTGFPNRRYALEMIERERTAALRSGRPFSLLLIDLDRFKLVNDTHGHDVGDKVLKHTAEMLRAAARTHEVICRLGGEEFLAICPGTGLPGAESCAERLRAAVEKNPFNDGSKTLRVTVSIGAAVLSGKEQAGTELLKAADLALYRAKDAGRNRICVAQP